MKKLIYIMPIAMLVLAGCNDAASIFDSEILAVLDADLAAVRSCDAVYLLKGWESSRGARKELAEALSHGLKIMQEGDTP